MLYLVNMLRYLVGTAMVLFNWVIAGGGNQAKVMRERNTAAARASSTQSIPSAATTSGNTPVNDSSTLHVASAPKQGTMLSLLTMLAGLLVCGHVLIVPALSHHNARLQGVSLLDSSTQPNSSLVASPQQLDSLLSSLALCDPTLLSLRTKLSTLDSLTLFDSDDKLACTANGAARLAEAASLGGAARCAARLPCGTRLITWFTATARPAYKVALTKLAVTARFNISGSYTAGLTTKLDRASRLDESACIADAARRTTARSISTDFSGYYAGTARPNGAGFEWF